LRARTAIGESADRQVQMESLLGIMHETRQIIEARAIQERAFPGAAAVPR
jgi:hypothetical protein